MRPVIRVTVLGVLAVLLLAVCSCAVLSEDHRHIAYYLDEHAVPEGTAAKVAAAPLAIPTGLAALSIDGFAINPVLNVPRAFEDAKMVFDPEIVPYASVGEILVFPMRIVTFVVIFVGSEVARCLFPFPD